MPNTARGESEFFAGAERYVMRLTLGALAEIESGLGVKSLSEIAGRLKTLGAGDVATIASALLRGAGSSLTAADVLKLETDLGTLIGAITDAFDAVGLGSGAKAPSASSAAPRESIFARGDAEPQRESASPLAGAASSNSPSA
jgi:hypothetical protein